MKSASAKSREWQREWYFLIGLAFLMLTAACTGSTSSDSPPKAIGSNRPPVIKSAKISQAVISQTDQVTLEIDAEDPDHDTVNFEFQWYANGAPLSGQTNAILSGVAARRGQQISVEITPTDGTLKGQPYRTAGVSLGNTPPKVTAVTLAPSELKSGDRIDARMEASDPDSDRVDAIYRWFKNNALVKESDEPFLITTGLAPGDSVAVEVTVRDLTATGNSLRSEPLIVGNNLPKIVSTPPAVPVQPDRYEYLVKAVDSDGEPLHYFLESGPPGMTISEQSGLLDWPLTTSSPGVFHVKVGARDSHGGTAVQEFDLTLSASGPVKSAGA